MNAKSLPKNMPVPQEVLGEYTREMPLDARLVWYFPLASLSDMLRMLI